jgi:hypothetical protein
MDNWTKKKRAAESFGGQGMTRYIDSNEARRLSRLKNVRSSIGGTMSQHSGWQRAQIEKRRREQLRQRKKQAKKKPLGDGIRVDTGIHPCDYTKTGLKLKLDQPSTTKQIVKEKALSSLSRLQTLQTRKDNSVKGYGPRKLNAAPKQEDYSSREVTPADVCLLDDGAIVLLQVKERIKDLSVSTTANKNAQPNKKKTNKTRSSGQTSILKNKYQSDEGKENDDNSFDHQPMLQSSRTSNKKPEPKRHFQLLTDINSLKREHVEALNMLQELDGREENRRRSLGSASTSYSFDSDESSGDEYCRKVSNDGRITNDYNVLDNTILSHREDEYGEVVSSSEAYSGPDTELKTLDNPEESFAWLPEGINDATHLSIVLNDEIESQEDADVGISVCKSECQEEVSAQCNDCSVKDATPKSFQDYKFDENNDATVAHYFGAGSESSSHHTDEYLSDTSGY